MCILFIAIGQHSDYPLIITANRDEYFARASDPMHYWPDHPEILAGRDRQAGGTWLGVNQQGRFAAVTNYRSSAKLNSDARSRGELVTRFLNSGTNRQELDEFNQFLASENHYYNPFNLIYGDQKSLFAWSHTEANWYTLKPGFHSVSNGPIDQHWPKMSRGVEKLTGYIRASDVIEPDRLLQIMHDTTQANVSQVPETGIDTSREQQLSSIFVRGTDYGTRTTTLLLFSSSQIELTEYNYGSDGDTSCANKFIVKRAID
jgi:uncharacterized protein with NRDE domain